jgi:uncharacterized repeat protein (TIGR03803 family)
MVRLNQFRAWISRICSRSAGTIVALAIILMPTFFATSSIQAQTYTVLYSFTSGADGANPLGGLVRDSAGNLYGTTYQGGGSCGNGSENCGTVFELDTSGKETVLYAFPPGGGHGVGPVGTLVRDARGSLYGVTFLGGAQNLGRAFELLSGGGEMGIHTFRGGAWRPPDGANPSAGLIRDSSGNLYGTTTNGGTGSCSDGCGTVFEISRGKESVLYLFSGSDGAYPRAPLVRDAKGNLYGTASTGGIGSSCVGDMGCGLVFEVDPSGKETVLYKFTGAADGGQPEAGLLRDATGNLYGTTAGGGTGNAGTVFKLDKAGKETVLHRFKRGGSDGIVPFAGLVRDSAGNLYGTTAYGGSGTACQLGCGIVFKLDKTRHETVLHTFTGGTDGALPEADLIQDAAGNLYGTTYDGGGNGCGGAGCGTVFKITLNQ